MTSRNRKKRPKRRTVVVVLWLLCAICAGALAALCWHMFAAKAPAAGVVSSAAPASVQPAPQPAPQVTRLRVCHRR